MTEKMSINEIIGIAGAVGALINIIVISWQAWKKSKPEIRKIEKEADTEDAELHKASIEGAQLSMAMLEHRLNDLQSDLSREKQARKDDYDYFRRRIRELDRENREYRSWASRLAKQVISAGLIPVAFEPIVGETDPALTAIKDDKEKK